jgi:hypothetical protein
MSKFFPESKFWAFEGSMFLFISSIFTKFNQVEAFIKEIEGGDVVKILFRGTDLENLWADKKM